MVMDICAFMCACVCMPETPDGLREDPKFQLLPLLSVALLQQGSAQSSAAGLNTRFGHLGIYLGQCEVHVRGSVFFVAPWAVSVKARSAQGILRICLSKPHLLHEEWDQLGLKPLEGVLGSVCNRSIQKLTCKNLNPKPLNP